MYLFPWDYVINHNENVEENQKKDHRDMTYFDLGTNNIVNTKIVLVRWYLYVSWNT